MKERGVLPEYYIVLKSLFALALVFVGFDQLQSGYLVGLALLGCSVFFVPILDTWLISRLRIRGWWIRTFAVLAVVLAMTYFFIDSWSRYVESYKSSRLLLESDKK